MKAFGRLFWIIVLSFLIISCGRNKMRVPEGIMQPDEMVSMLVDLHLADGYLHNLPITQYNKRDSAFNIYPGILKKYNITRPQLDSIFMFYGQYPNEFAKIYDQVLEELSKMEGEAREADTLTNPERMEE